MNFSISISGAHPVTNPCIIIPTILDTTQYNASPLGKVVVKKPNIIGIIQSIIRLVCAWRGSADGIVVVFCIRNMDKPTSTGITGRESGFARSSHRKVLLMGITSFTPGSHEYRCPDNPTRRSGVDGRVWMTAWNRPIQIGNWMKSGPRQPIGLTPFVL